MDDANQLLTKYEPIDISKIKPSQIKTEKELEAEATSICETLRDTSRYFLLF